MNQAFNNAFTGRANFPNFKSKVKSKWSYTTCRASKNDKNLRLEKGGWLVLPKIPGRVKTSVSRNPKGILVSATITKARSGKWFVSLSYEQHIEAPVFIDNIGCMANPIGLDLGVKDLAITSEGEVFNNPRYAYRAKKKHAIARANSANNNVRSDNTDGNFNINNNDNCYEGGGDYSYGGDVS